MTREEKQAIHRLQQATGLVGGAYAVVDHGQVRTVCFGLADRETGRPITENSFFDIASNSKAFTAMLGAIAAGRGQFDWDDTVRSHIPGFTMVDPYAGEQVTCRDFGCHRTGLGRHEFMRARVYTSVEDMALRTRYMEPDRGFRESYRYNNQGFILLGHVMERVFGEDWQTLIRREIAGPLGMDVLFRGRDCDFGSRDRALPYRCDGKGGAFPCGYADNHVAGPCGGIRTNLKGMLAWLQCLLAGGAPLCGKKQLEQLWECNMPTDDGSGRELFCGYGLGWRTSAYRGRRLISHGGSIQGFNSHVALFPEENSGIVILMNTSSTWGAALLRDVLLDELCGAPLRDIEPEIGAWRLAMNGQNRWLTASQKGRLPDETEQSRLLGRFFHPAYEDFTVARRGEELWLDYGNFTGPVRMLPDGTALACQQDAIPDWMQLQPREGGLLVKTSDLDLWLKFDKIDE